ncbi:hypothetical protein D3C85_1347500 [compost metagenome]
MVCVDLEVGADHLVFDRVGSQDHAGGGDALHGAAEEDVALRPVQRSAGRTGSLEDRVGEKAVGGQLTGQAAIELETVGRLGIPSKALHVV